MENKEPLPEGQPQFTENQAYQYAYDLMINKGTTISNTRRMLVEKRFKT